MGEKKKRHAVPLHVVRAVLASYLVGDDNLGIDGGEFANRLIRLIAIADEANLAMLATLYPDYVAAVKAVAEPWGIDWLRKRAREVAA